MADILKYIAVTSVTGGLLTVILYALSPVTRRLFSPVWQYYIWLIVLFLLVVPISLKYYVYTQDSLANYRTEISVTESASRPVAEMGSRIVDRYKADRNAFLGEKKDIDIIDIFKIITFLWGAGVICILSVKILRYIVFKRALYKNSRDYRADGLPKQVILRKTNVLDAPLMIGIFRPVIYLPDMDISEESLSYILKHELVHFKRRDILYKWLAMLVGCIHWFNPAVYLLIKCIDEDCEVSCDYTVSKNMSSEERQRYMNTLLDIASYSVRKSRPLSTQMSGSKKLIMRRFTAIKKGKRKLSSFGAGLIAAVIVLSGSVYGANIVNDGVSAVKAEAEYKFISNNELYFSYGNNVLLIGTLDKPRPLAEFAMLINCKNGISALSIPAEAELEENMSLRYDFMGENREKVIGALENKLGIHIDKYAVFNVNALKTIADKTNGVDTYIAHKMFFADTGSGIEKEFRKGINKLSGEDIMDMLLFKDPKYGNAENLLNLFSGCMPMLFEKENLAIIDSNIISTDIEGSLADYSHMLRQACYKRVCLMLMPWNTTEPSGESMIEYYGYMQRLFSLYDRQPDMKKIRLQLTDIAE